MKNSILLICAAALFSVNAASAQSQAGNVNVDELVSAMTLEEKVHMVIGCGMAFGDDVKFPGTAGRTYDIPRLGIPSVYLADGPHRLVMAPRRDFDSNFYYTTEFPSSTTLAATFDTCAAYEIGEALGSELRDYGLDVLLAPGVNLMRNSLCGRNHEYYSEDPLVSGMMAAGYINGIQSTGTGTCIKHFAVNSQETNRNAGDSRLNPRALRELYLRSFEIAIRESDPWSVMTAYNKVNGKFTCEDYDLTETILRGEWAYDGMVMSDWNAGTDAVASMIAGNDMLQPGQPRQYNAILEAVKSGSLDEAVLDRNIRRILNFVFKCHSAQGYEYPNCTDLEAHKAIDRRIGAEGIVLLDNNGVLPFGSSVRKVALYGSTSYDIVPAGMGFGSTGFGYYHVSMVEGLRNAGYEVDKGLVRQYKKFIADEEKRNYPNGRPPFSLTAPLRAAEFTPSAEEMAAQVAANDLAVITLGRTSGEGADRRREEFYLKDSEAALIKAVSEAYHAAGKKLVVILNICSPMETASWKDMADAVVCAFQPGQEVGNCIVDVLGGKVNPSGKLPMTFAVNYGDAASDANFPYDYEFKMPSFAMGSGMNFQGKAEEEAPKGPVRNVDYTEYQEGIYVGYRYFDSFAKEVSYPFGHGLSYTEFGYEMQGAAIEGDSCVATLRVTNIGAVAGRESVQLYVSAPKGKLKSKPVKELRAFSKTRLLQPGESEILNLRWNVMDMASFNEKSSSWELAKGEYVLHAASSSADLRSSCNLKIAKAREKRLNRAMLPEAAIQELF